MFESLKWTDDGLMLGDLIFRIEQSQMESCSVRDNCFMLFKTRGIIEQYASFFQKRWPSGTGEQVKNIVELGIWDGGSLVLWNEYFRPKKYVALDYSNRGDSEYFKLYKKTRKLEGSIQTYWGVDQANSKRVQEIMRQEFDEPIDLIIDDASHQYLGTKASFETLFPLLRPGGLYIIEDWAWGCWRDPNAAYDPKFVVAGHPKHFLSSIYSKKTPLSKLVIEILMVTGSTWLIEEITVCQGFVAVQRSWHQLQDFRLDNLLPVNFAMIGQQPSQDVV